MVDEGYAAVSTRSVAARAGLKPALVHYYFVTTDDLFLATYRRAADRYFERLAEALDSNQPLASIWELSMNPTRTTLAVEFMALANHRKVIRTEIARNIERTREVQSQWLARLPRTPVNDPKVCPPAAMSFLIAALTRSLVMEDALGVSAGHAEAQSLVKWWIKHFEGTRRKPSKRPRVPRAKK
jgi:AcrR family transcriptional regulator